MVSPICSPPISLDLFPILAMLLENVRARMPAHSIKPELHVPAPQLKREQSLVALFYPAKRQLLRVLKYIARTLLKLSFLSSSPTTPATQSGLCGVVLHMQLGPGLWTLPRRDIHTRGATLP
jgi:hypothetical protein